MNWIAWLESAIDIVNPYDTCLDLSCHCACFTKSRSYIIAARRCYCQVHYYYCEFDHDSKTYCDLSTLMYDGFEKQIILNMCFQNGSVPEKPCSHSWQKYLICITTVNLRFWFFLTWMWFLLNIISILIKYWIFFEFCSDASAEFQAKSFTNHSRLAAAPPPIAQKPPDSLPAAAPASVTAVSNRPDERKNSNFATAGSKICILSFIRSV